MNIFEAHKWSRGDLRLFTRDLLGLNLDVTDYPFSKKKNWTEFEEFTKRNLLQLEIKPSAIREAPGYENIMRTLAFWNFLETHRISPPLEAEWEEMLSQLTELRFIAFLWLGLHYLKRLDSTQERRKDPALADEMGRLYDFAENFPKIEAQFAEADPFGFYKDISKFLADEHLVSRAGKIGAVGAISERTQELLEPVLLAYIGKRQTEILQSGPDPIKQKILMRRKKRKTLKAKNFDLKLTEPLARDILLYDLVIKVGPLLSAVHVAPYIEEGDLRFQVAATDWLPNIALAYAMHLPGNRRLSVWRRCANPHCKKDPWFFPSRIDQVACSPECRNAIKQRNFERRKKWSFLVDENPWVPKRYGGPCRGPGRPRGSKNRRVSNAPSFTR